MFSTAVIGRGSPTTTVIISEDDLNLDVSLSTLPPLRETSNESVPNSASYTVALPVAPTAEVTVAVASEDTDVATVSPTSLTFTSTTWSTAQMVTVTAVPDDIVNPSSRSVKITHTPSSTDDRFNSDHNAPEVMVTVQDDDTAGLAFVPASLTVDEGSSGSYTVALTSRPTGTVMVTVASNNTDVTVDTNSGSPGNQNTLSFTTTTWDTGQTVTVAADEDDDTTNDSATLTHTANGGGYNSVTGNVAVIVTDDDSPSVTLSVSAASITEGGSALTLTAVRSEANTSGDTLSFPIRVKAAGTTAQPADYTALAANIGILNNASSGVTTFAVTNDSADEPPEKVVVELHTPPSGTVLGATTEVEITIVDNDATEVTLSVPDATAAEGSSTNRAMVRLSLNRALRNGESLAIPLAFSGGAVGTDFTLALLGTYRGVALSGSTVTFMGSNSGSATTADILLSASEDGDTTDETVTVSIPSLSSGAASILTATGLGGGATGSRTGNGQIVLSDTTPTVSFAAASGSAAESVGTRNVALNISPAPTANITVNYAVGGTAGNSDFSITGSGTITVPANTGSVNIPVAITDDNVDESAETVILTLGSGADYAVGSTNVHTLTITDNDSAGLVFSPASVAVAEGGSGAYTVRLATQPTGTVTVTVGGASGEVTVDTNSGTQGNQNTLSFTISTWNTAQTVTVAAGEDDDTTNDSATLSHTATGGGYNSVTGNVAVTVTDNDTAGLVFSVTSLTVAEGSSGSYTVRLATQPTGTVTVTVG
ncbi:MAG: hypothetical protein OXF25_06850, partial [Cyanobacteria bacterium MAG CAR3_bin_5]|nr:hypothetical protein [Cyanobacteria bacterium MAG CAR3_bin_5]